MSVRMLISMGEHVTVSTAKLRCQQQRRRMKSKAEKCFDW